MRRFPLGTRGAGPSIIRAALFLAGVIFLTGCISVGRKPSVGKPLRNDFAGTYRYSNSRTFGKPVSVAGLFSSVWNVQTNQSGLPTTGTEKQPDGCEVTIQSDAKFETLRIVTPLKTATFHPTLLSDNTLLLEVNDQQRKSPFMVKGGYVHTRYRLYLQKSIHGSLYLIHDQKETTAGLGIFGPGAGYSHHYSGVILEPVASSAPVR